MSEKLLPCPFCGAKAVMNYNNLVHCSETVKCGAQVESGDHGDRTSWYTIKAWNTRISCCPEWDSRENECMD